MPPDQNSSSCLQSDLKYPWLNISKYKVDVINTQKHGSGSESTLTLTVAQSLVKLLDYNLSNRSLYFVSKLDSNIHTNGADEKSSVELIQTKEDSFKSSFSDDNHNDRAIKNESVIGSPLKLKEIADLAPLSPSSPLFSKETLASKGLDISQQIPIREAQLVMQKFQKLKRDQTEPMLAVLCNVQDVRKTLMIGTCKESVEDQAITTFLLTMQKVHLSCLDDPSRRNYGGKKYQMESTYDLLDTELGLGTIRLTAKWEDMKGSLKISKPLSTEFYLEWNTAMGNQQSPVFAIYRELQKLSSFLKVLRKECDVDEVFPEREDTACNATNKLHELFARRKDGDMVSKSMLGVLDAGNSRLNLNPAVDRDFTDELWGVLSCCSGLQEMVNCIRMTFDEMRRGQVVVFVSTDNQSTIANLSRAAASGLAVFPPLSDTQLALRLVTEIGLEKLRKLYHALLVTTNKLCSPAQWEKLYGQKTSASRSVQGEDNEEIICLSKQFSVLEQLHSCFECVAIIGTFTDCMDLTKVANVVLSAGECSSGKGYKMQATPALALPEIDSRQWSSIRRKTVSNGLTMVETFCRNMPEGILETPCEPDCVWHFVAKQNKQLTDLKE